MVINPIVGITKYLINREAIYGVHFYRGGCICMH